VVSRKSGPDGAKPQPERVQKQRGRQLLMRAVKAVKDSDPDLSDHDSRALERLSADRRAQRAYDYLPNQDAADALVWTYIAALEIRRTFNDEIAESRRLLGSARQQGKLDRLKNSLVAVERFFEDLKERPLGWVASQHRVPPGTLTALFVALVFAKDLLEGERRIASETPKRLGATRKLGPGAAELAAIGWLAGDVRHYTGKPNREVVRLLAEVVLQREVTDDRVRKAERIRLGREWQLPLRTEDSGKSPYVGKLMSSRRTEPLRRTAAVAKQARLVERTVGH
jgi:hypothetical protein